MPDGVDKDYVHHTQQTNNPLGPLCDNHQAFNLPFVKSHPQAHPAKASYF